MSDRGDKEDLDDILEAISRILDYSKGMTWDEFLADRKTQDAIVQNIEILGEATKNLSEALKVNHPEVPWKDIAATRDRLIHRYFGVNNEIVWQIICTDLPKLLPQIKSILSGY